MTSPNEPAGWVSADQVEQMIAAQLAAIKAEHEQEIAGLRADLAAAQGARQVLSAIPADSGGPGVEIAETWSQFEQDLLKAERHANDVKVLAARSS